MKGFLDQQLVEMYPDQLFKYIMPTLSFLLQLIDLNWSRVIIIKCT